MDSEITLQRKVVIDRYIKVGVETIRTAFFMYNHEHKDVSMAFKNKVSKGLKLNNKEYSYFTTTLAFELNKEIEHADDDDDFFINERNKIITKTLTLCTNATHLYTFSIAFINEGLSMMWKIWDTLNCSQNNESKLIKAFNKISKIQDSFDDEALEAIRTSVMPLIWQQMNMFRTEYNGYSNILDTIQDDMSKKTESLFERCFGVCSDIKIDMTKYCAVTYAIINMVATEIDKLYDTLVDKNRLIKAINGHKINTKHLYEIADEIIVIAKHSNAPFNKKNWIKAMQPISNIFAREYASSSKYIINSIQQGAKDYFSYCFGMLVLSKRNNMTITERIKECCNFIYDSKGGYAQVMKDVNKLNGMTSGIDNPYMIGAVLLEKIEHGEKFPSFSKTINNIVKKKENANT